MTLRGYRRPDGRVGIRNHLLVISSVVCANRTAEMIAAQVPGAIPLVHQHGCGELLVDRKRTLRVLGGYGSHPNVGAALVVGLGCEGVSAEAIAGVIEDSGRRVEHLDIQDHGGTLGTAARGAAMLARMEDEISGLRREPISWADLILGTECGGSDATSGLAANPACGWAADAVVLCGGTVMLSETTEMVGAEHLLADRAETDEIAAEVQSMVERFEEKAMALGEDLRGTQPAPGNIEGGLTTIEEKSLGCIFKAGTSPIREVLEYGERPTIRGLVVMDTPGYDVESVCGMVAGGAQLVVFTTGRGTPTGCPVGAVLKVTGNARLARTMGDNIDVDVSGIITGEESATGARNRILEKCEAVVNGQRTRAEILGQRDFAITRVGPSV